MEKLKKKNKKKKAPAPVFPISFEALSFMVNWIHVEIEIN